MLPQNPDMLFSYLNLQLRDHYSSLEELCDRLDEDQASILAILKEPDMSIIRTKMRLLPRQILSAKLLLIDWMRK